MQQCRFRRHPDRTAAAKGEPPTGLSLAAKRRISQSRERKGDGPKPAAPADDGSGTLEGYFPFFGLLVMVSTVAVLFRAVAAFTDMKRPFFEFRPIFLPLDMRITPFPGRTGPALRRSPAGGSETMSGKT